VQREDDVVLSWRLEQEMRTGACALSDYNFETPSTRLEVNAASNINQGGNSRFEIFDYPGDYGKRDAGDGFAKIRMEEEEAAHTVITGESDVRAFVSGYKFTLKGYERRDQNAPYILTAVSHAGEEGGFYSGAGSETEATYSNTFTAMPATVKFRPPRLTPKRLVYGTQTAVVVGPSGEEIYTDKYGRVKVQFHWDRRGTMDEKSSCWVRVSQPWAGKGWGAVWLPRIGQEVIVDFLEGDPDRPIITGRVYNAQQMPPYALPDEMTKSTFKSYSSKGGGGFNELRFEDKKGSEEVFLHAEKDLELRVKNDLHETVVNERHLTVQSNMLEQIDGDHSFAVKGDQNQKVDGTVSLKAGQDLQMKVGNNCALDSGTEIHLKAGMTLVIESGTTLTLKVGGNFVNIDSSGVTIQGTLVNINSGGAAGSGAGANPNPPKAPKEAVKANPGDAAQPPPAPAPPKIQQYSPQAAVLKAAAQSGAPFCDI
jgi:type VI secretion system secreted protein VgrG